MVFSWNFVASRPEPEHNRLSLIFEGTAVVNACLGTKEIRRIIRDYQAGKTLQELADLHQVTKQAIWYHLEANGIPRRSSSKRKYSLRQDAFDDAEHNPEAAYWVGFLMADGCVHKNKEGTCYTILGLASVDQQHMENFRNFLGTDIPLRIKERFTNPQGRSGYYPFTHISISSSKLYYALNRYGIVERKSKIAKVKLLENDRDFWRGCIDGDGSVGCTNNKKCGYNTPMLSLVGSKELTEQFANFVCSVRHKFPTVSPHRSIWRVRLQGRDAIEVVRVLYQEGDMALDRKKQQAQEVLSWKSKKNKLTEEQVVEIREWYATKSCTLAYLAKLYDMSVPAIHSIVHRKTWTYV